VLLPITQEELDKMQLNHGQLQLAPARKLLVDYRPTLSRACLIGDPAAEIVRVAKAEGVDAIVMGTRGMRALGTWPGIDRDQGDPFGRSPGHARQIVNAAQ
jgi:nucleotide-binding universal stress UspA family protein